jgi:hypothetical protein
MPKHTRRRKSPMMVQMFSQSTSWNSETGCLDKKIIQIVNGVKKVDKKVRCCTRNKKRKCKSYQ